jgi:hypothetical protein
LSNKSIDKEGGKNFNDFIIKEEKIGQIKKGDACNAITFKKDK